MILSMLERLETASKYASTAIERAEALARLGIYLAQLGRCDEADEILDRLCKEYPSGYVPRVTIRVMILSGVIPYYRCIKDSSDRIRRACALAAAAGFSDLTAEAHLWNAHLAYNFDRYNDYGESIRHILNGFSNLDDSSRARACLLVADGLQYLGERLRSDEWYALARVLSRRAHDRALIVAIEYNRLGMGLSRLRVEWALSNIVESVAARNWLLEIESVRGLHLGFHAQALNDLIDLCDAYAHEARGDFRRAELLLSRLRVSSVSENGPVSMSLLDLEIAWCKTMAGDWLGQDDVLMASLDRISSLPPNERLMGLFFLRALVARNGFRVDEQRLREMIDHSVSDLEQSCAMIAKALESVDEFVPAIKSLIYC